MPVARAVLARRLKEKRAAAPPPPPPPEMPPAPEIVPAEEPAPPPPAPDATTTTTKTEISMPSASASSDASAATTAPLTEDALKALDDERVKTRGMYLAEAEAKKHAAACELADLTKPEALAWFTFNRAQTSIRYRVETAVAKAAREVEEEETAASAEGEGGAAAAAAPKKRFTLPAEELKRMDDERRARRATYEWEAKQRRAQNKTLLSRFKRVREMVALPGYAERSRLEQQAMAEMAFNVGARAGGAAAAAATTTTTTTTTTTEDATRAEDEPDAVDGGEKEEKDAEAEEAATDEAPATETETETAKAKAAPVEAEEKEAEVRSIHWSPYDRVGVVNADP